MRKIYQVQLKLAEEVSTISTNFRTRTLEVVENIQGQLTWIETNAAFLEDFPQKTMEILKIEFELLDFSSKATVRLTVGVGKTLERCMDFYKKKCSQHIIGVKPLQKKEPRRF